MRYSTPFLAAGVFLVASFAFSQRPPAAATSSVPIRPSRRTPSPSPRMLLSGRVVMADDSQLPVQVAIERVCDGTPHREAYADSSGNFSFEAGRDETAMIDATTDVGPDFSSGPPIGNRSSLGRITGMPGPEMLEGGSSSAMQRNAISTCELRAAAPGYRSSVINLAGHQPMDPPDVGTIVLQRFERAEGTVISAVTARAPGASKKAYEKGLQLQKKGKPQDAQHEFEKAVALYPQHADAWVELGRLHISRNEVAPARAAFQKSLDADSRFVTPYVELAYLSAIESKWAEVLNWTEKAIALDPLDFPSAFFFRGLAEFNLGQLDEAEKNARQADRIDGLHRFPRNILLLGGILFQKRDFTGAVEQYRTYLKLFPQAPDADRVRAQLMEVQKQMSAHLAPSK